MKSEIFAFCRELVKFVGLAAALVVVITNVIN